MRPKPDPCGRSDRPRPRGFSLIEATVAVVLLLVALATAVQAIGWIARDRRAIDRRSVAIREAENLLERLTAGLSEGAGGPSLSIEAGRALPDGTVEVERVREEADGLALERITVTVRYRDRPGVMAAPVRLTTWAAPPPEAPGPTVEEDTP